MDDGEEAPPPPEGYVAAQGRGGFSTHNGPYFHRPADEGSHQAFYALKRHCNGLGLIHGGMLSAFLDGVLASAAGRGSGSSLVTIHLSIDFLGMGRAGDWVFGEGHLTRATRDVAFAEGRVWVRKHDLARATGIFKLMRRPIGRG